MEQQWQMIDDRFNFVIESDADYRQYLANEPDVETLDKAVQTMLQERKTVPQMAMQVLVAEALGHTTEEIIGTPKVVLRAGASRRFSDRVAALHCTKNAPNGREIQVRELVMHVSEPEFEEDEEGDIDVPIQDSLATELSIEKEQEAVVDEVDYPVSIDHPLALDRAKRYFDRNVPGYIMGRLKIIAANGTRQEVEDAAEQLKVKIDAMVAQLCD
jgi:hypothetical protein